MKPFVKIKVVVLLAALCSLFVSCSQEETNTELIHDTNVTYDKIESDILLKINGYRLNIGLTSIERIDVISYQADNHNKYMIKEGKVSHSGFIDRERYLAKYIGADFVSENVAFGYQTAAGVVQGWLDSELHRKNIEGNFDCMGISAMQDKDGLYYFTHIFVKR